MSVSVIIPSAGTIYGRKALLAAALRSVTQADEVVVVLTNDEISGAGRRAITAAGARIVHSTEDFNFSHAINAGAAETSGEWLMILNDDVSLPHGATSDWLTTLAGKRGDVKGIKLLDADEDRIQHAGVWFRGPGSLPSHVGWREPATLPYRDENVWAVTGAAMMIRRSTFEELGGFDEAFPMNFGDVDFCLRAHAKGYQVNVWNSITLVHLEAATKTPSDLLPSFYVLTERHGNTLAKDGIVLNPEAAATYFSGLTAH